jgi:hypothetical protein
MKVTAAKIHEREINCFAGSKLKTGWCGKEFGLVGAKFRKRRIPGTGLGV